MLAKRIIPCLDVKDGRTVKGINFEGLRDVGDAVALGSKYAREGADELVYLDISATQEGRNTFTHLVNRIAEAIDIPFTVGGGISTKQEIVLMKGGRGGKGNAFFKTATMQAPKFAQPGEPSLESWIIIELKLLADVGLVGFPNAGKSTLLSVVSAAKPEIADYPFTTLTPNLGIVPYYDMKSFIMADIPGIIEGASEGKGLGLRFLRHIERNSILLFLVAADSPDVKEAYDILLGELKKYNPELLDKKRILAISKCDLIDEQQRKDIKKHLPKKIPHIFISSAAGEGIKELKDLIWLSLTAEEE